MRPYFETPDLTLYNGEALAVLEQLAEESINTCITSPPYFSLRDYEVEGQVGLEQTPQEYVMRLVEIFRAVRRLLKEDGTLWLNIGDSYCRHPAKGQHKPGDKGKQSYIYERGGGKASSSFDLESSGLKEKDLIGVPWRLALALQQPWLSCPDCGRESHGSAYPALLDGRRLCPACLAVNEPDVSEEGWYLRSDIIWHKPNALPNSVKDRPNTAHEYVFLLAKSSSYYHDYEAIKEPAVDGGTRTRRTVWSVNTAAYTGAHFAVFPPALIEPMVIAGAPTGGTVLDPFFGSGTTALVAHHHSRKTIGIELNPEYCQLAKERLEGLGQRRSLNGTVDAGV